MKSTSYALSSKRDKLPNVYTCLNKTSSHSPVIRNRKTRQRQQRQRQQRQLSADSFSSSPLSYVSPVTVSDASFSPTINSSHSSLFWSIPSILSDITYSNDTTTTSRTRTSSSSSLSTRSHSKFSFVNELVIDDDASHHKLNDSPAYNTRSRTRAKQVTWYTSQLKRHDLNTATRASARTEPSSDGMLKEMAVIESGRLSESFLKKTDRWLQTGGSLLSMAVSVGPNSPNTNRLGQLLDSQNMSVTSSVSRKRSRHSSPRYELKSTRLPVETKRYKGVVSPRRRIHDRSFSFVNSPLVARRSPHLVRHYTTIHKPDRPLLLPSLRNRSNLPRRSDQYRLFQQDRYQTGRYSPRKRQRQQQQQRNKDDTSSSLSLEYWSNRLRLHNMSSSQESDLLLDE